MNLNPVILAIPVYFTLMGLELVFESISRRKTYRLSDAVTNINLGALDQLTGTFTYVIKVGIYTIVYEQFRFLEIPPTWVSFVVLFVLWDLCYYWSHRMAHEVSLFWGGHVVHHQSEDFNLSVALRQSSTAFLWSMPFYLPLALLGFSPTQFLLVGGFNLLYQFWIHTEHIDRLGPLEWVLNTPSHHRVHHGRNPEYIDRNYAGVFIVWDRLFGTFQQEQQRPTYGITKPLSSWNPLYANVAHYIDLFRTVRKTRSFGDAVRTLFHRPGWRPDYLGGYEAPSDVPPDYRKHASSVADLRANVYLLTQFAVLMIPVAFYLFRFTEMDALLKGTFAIWIAVSTLVIGVLFDARHPWVRSAEYIRQLCFPVGVWWLQSSGMLPDGWPWLGVAVVISVAGMYGFRSIFNDQPGAYSPVRRTD